MDNNLVNYKSTLKKIKNWTKDEALFESSGSRTVRTIL